MNVTTKKIAATAAPKTSLTAADDTLYSSIEKPQSVSASPKKSPPKFPFFSWQVLGLILCALALGCASYALGAAWPWFQSKPTAPLTPAELAAQPDSAVPLRPGPWGNLEALPIYIEPPDEYLPIDSIEQADRRWRFTGFTPDQLLALFQSADLTADQRAFLSDTSKWQQDAKAIYVSPSKDLVLALSPKARKQIYEPMITDPGNLFYLLGHSYPTSRFDDYFADSGLPYETIELIKKLSFPYGNITFFCDMQLVMDTLQDAGQKARLVKTLPEIDPAPAPAHHARFGHRRIGALLDQGRSRPLHPAHARIAGKIASRCADRPGGTASSPSLVTDLHLPPSLP